MIDLANKLELAKIAKERLKHSITISIIIASITLFISFICTLYMVFFKTEMENLTYHTTNSLLNITIDYNFMIIILLVVNVIFIFIGNVNQTKITQIMQLDAFIKEYGLGDPDLTDLERQLSEISRLINEQDVWKKDKERAPIHTTRAVARDLFIEIGVLLIGGIAFSLMFFFKISIYPIAIICMWIGYLFMMGEYLYYQKALKQKRYLLHSEKHIGLIEESKDWVNEIASKNKILDMVYSRYETYLISMKVANNSINFFIIILLILDTTKVGLNEFFRLPEGANQFIMIFLLFVSVVIFIVDYSCQFIWMKVLVKINLIRGIIEEGNDKTKTLDKVKRCYASLTIKDIDIARGNHEYNIVAY